MKHDPRSHRLDTVPTEREEKLADIISDLQDRLNRGESIDAESWCLRHAEFAEQIVEFLDADSFFEGALAPGSTPTVTTSTQAIPVDRIDLNSFPVRTRIGDEPLGSVYRLESEERDLELVVVRAWFTPRERDRVEAACRRARGIDSSSAWKVLDTGRIGDLPFCVREHPNDRSLATIARLLVAGEGKLSFDDVHGILDHHAGEIPPDDMSMSFESSAAASRLARKRKHVRDVVWMFVRWARILDDLHQLGHAHLEITPWALRIDGSGEPRIQGFGLCWSGSGIPVEKMTGWVTSWLAPEQVRPGRPVTWKADIYGLAASLASVLSLRIHGSDVPAVDVVQDIAEGKRRPVADAPSLSRRLLAVLEQATSVDPTRRHDSAAALADDLEAAVQSTAGRLVRRFTRR